MQCTLEIPVRGRNPMERQQRRNQSRAALSVGCILDLASVSHRGVLLNVRDRCVVSKPSSLIENIKTVQHTGQREIHGSLTPDSAHCQAGMFGAPL